MTDHSHAPDELEDHDLGLSHDLSQIVRRERRAWGRRGLLGLVGGVGAAALVGCSDDDEATSSDSTTTEAAQGPGSGQPPQGQPPQGGGGAASDVDVADGEIPEETAGPYPGDGSNGVNVLSETGIVRSDLTSSFGSASGVAEGVPVTVDLKV